MANINANLLKISRKYIFPVIEEKMRSLKEKEGDVSILNMGVGDICLPLSPAVAEALKEAAEEMKHLPYGYGPAEGYLFLREKIAADYGNCSIAADEIFITDGINSSLTQMEELFSLEERIAIFDPSYPAYFDSNVMAGRGQISLLPCTEQNGFIPKPPKEHFDIIYLCSPSNPTGVAMTRSELEAYVAYAKEHDAVILFDGAYEAFVASKDVPKSIYEIEGAKEVALEFRSFSKGAGFTGLRLGYVVVPKAISLKFGNEKVSLHKYWKMRQNTKTNGVSFPIQRAALASLSGQGLRETREQVKHYKTQAKQIGDALKSKGFEIYGGIDSPFIWWKVPFGTSWEFFDYLLHTLKIVAIPGVGFGNSGEGYIRLSSFITSATTKEAISRLEGITCNMK